MYSQCPSCHARFRVNAATLRAAHGRARCGHCGHAFDALDHLSDELPRVPGSAPPVATDSGKSEATPPTLTRRAPQPDNEADPAGVAEPGVEDAGDFGLEGYHFSAEDIEKVFIDARDWQTQFGGPSSSQPSAPTEPPAVEDSEVVVEEPEGVEGITLEGLKVEIESDTGESLHLEAEFDGIDDEPVDEMVDLDSTSRLHTLENVPDSAYPDDEEPPPPEDADETAFYRALIEGRALPVPAVPPAAARPAPLRTAAGPMPATTAADAPIRGEIRATPAERWSEARRGRAVEDDLPDLDLPGGALPRRGRGWLALGSLLLALALAAQVTHYYRQAIVRHPQAGDALRRVYALIGQPLSPDWDLDAFEIRQWGPTVDIAPGEPLTVRASLTNRADHAQPYPLLRLEFEDRFGAAVAQRDFTPAEYLKSAPQAMRQIAAGGTTEAELSVVAPGGDAVGYTLDVCLREDVARIRCAHADD